MKNDLVQDQTREKVKLVMVESFVIEDLGERCKCLKLMCGSEV